MAGERTIRIKFDGSAAGLKRAAADAAKEVDGVAAKVEKKAGVFARIGQKIGLDLTGGISGAFSALPPQVQAVAVAAAAAIGVSMSAALAAALTGGILLAIGGGVLAAGIKAAANSPQVKSAFKTFGDRAKAAFKDFGTPFEGPLIRAADTFGDALERMAPTLKDMGKSMAPIIDKLAPALATMAEKALPGIQKAMEASKPLFDKLAEHMPKIGEAISKFFEEIAEGGPGAELFFERVLTAIEVFLPLIGKVIGGLSNLFIEIDKGTIKAYKAFFTLAIKVLDVFSTIINGAVKAFGWMPDIGPKLTRAAAEFNTFKDKANAALGKIEDEEVRIAIATAKQGFGSRSGSTQGLGRRAAGGPTVAGRSYLVGERGPELWTETSNGRITPNHELGGDTNVTVIIDGRALDSSVVRVVSERDRGLKRRAGAFA